MTRKTVTEQTQKLMQNLPATKSDLDHMRDTLDRWRVKVQVSVDEHHEALFGNGKPGMDEQIRNLTKNMDVLIKLGWIVASSVITMTLSGIIWAAVYIIRNTAP